VLLLLQFNQYFTSLKFSCQLQTQQNPAIEVFGKNEQVKKVFWIFFIGIAGLVLARVVDLATAQQIVGIITGIGG